MCSISLVGRRNRSPGHEDDYALSYQRTFIGTRDQVRSTILVLGDCDIDDAFSLCKDTSTTVEEVQKWMSKEHYRHIFQWQPEMKLFSGVEKGQ